MLFCLLFTVDVFGLQVKFDLGIGDDLMSHFWLGSLFCCVTLLESRQFGTVVSVCLPYMPRLQDSIPHVQ